MSETVASVSITLTPSSTPASFHRRLGVQQTLTCCCVLPFRLKGRDLYTAGIATHFVPSENMGQLEAQLVQLSQDGASVGAVADCAAAIQCIQSTSVQNKHLPCMCVANNWLWFVHRSDR